MINMNYCSFLKKIHLVSSYFLILVLRDRKEKINSEMREKKVLLLQIQVCDEGIPELLKKKKKKFSNMKDLPEFFCSFSFHFVGVKRWEIQSVWEKASEFFQVLFLLPQH